MAVIAYRLNAVQQANRAQKKVLKWASSVSLGDEQGSDDIEGKGARYEQGDGTVWLVFSDLRFSLADVANLGTLCAALPNVPAGFFDNNTPAEIRQAAINYVQANRVIPDYNAMPEDEDPFKYTRDAQINVPAWFEARLTVPPGLSPVDPNP